MNGEHGLRAIGPCSDLGSVLFLSPALAEDLAERLDGERKQVWAGYTPCWAAAPEMRLEDGVPPVAAGRDARGSAGSA